MEVLTGSQEKKTLRFRFGVFEADLHSGELRKSGVRVRVQAQPFRILTFLLEHPGKVVSREELLQRFWGADTMVDMERSLATAIHKIRECLDDSVVNPRFIETLPRVGYRFIAPVAAVVADLPQTPRAPEANPSQSQEAEPMVLPAPATPAVPAPARQRRPWLTIASIGLLGSLGGYYASWRAGSGLGSPPHISQVMFSDRFSPGDPLFQGFPGMATDGSRIYFPQIENGHPALGEVLIANGETGTVPLPEELGAPWVNDISPDGFQLLLGNHLSTEPEQALWIASTSGGAARRVPGILAHDAAWMPDGRRIIYASGNDLYIAQDDGTENRKLVTLPGRAFWLRWSPDQSKLRLTLLSDATHTPAIWEVQADGSNGHKLLGKQANIAAECCGSWTADGRYYVFQSTSGGESNIWAVPEHGSFFGGPAEPARITNGPLSFQAPIEARDGRQIFFVGHDTKSELLRFDGKSRNFVPYSNNLRNARGVEFTRDGKSIAWIRQDDGSLWRSRSDGSFPTQLTTSPMQVFSMRWSPDGRQLAVMGRQTGTPWKLYIVDGETGRMQPVSSENQSEADPGWSPDGRTLVFGRASDRTAEGSQLNALYMVDLATQQVAGLPGSEGLFSPRWSADGKYIAAVSSDKTKLMIYNVINKTWRQLAEQSIDDPTWSHDDSALFFDDFAQAGHSVYRVALATGKVERVGDLNDLGLPKGVNFQFAGLAPGDVPLVNASTSAAYIYSADLPR